MSPRKIAPENKKFYLPLRVLVASLVPTVIITWYFIDKVGQNIVLKVVLVLIALAVQVVVVAVTNRTRKTRQPFFYGIYDFLTGNGNLPLRLFANGIVAIAVIALGFELSGLQPIAGVPHSFIARYVEVDLYWTTLNFLGISDTSIQPIGFSKMLTILATAIGFIFWGMYISVLINKYTEIRRLFSRKTPVKQLDRLLFNEDAGRSNKRKSKKKIE